MGAWSPGNFFPKDAEALGSAKDSNGFDEFCLCGAKDAWCKHPSKYVAAGSDQKDIGVDIDLLDAATKGVI